MPARLAALLIAIAALPATALPGSAQEADPLAEYLWVARPVVIFADSPLDPRVAEQLAEFEEQAEELEERDVVVIVDTDPDSALRDVLRPRDFQFVLIGKDGEVKYRRPDPVPVRELSRLIDRMPSRQDELQAERAQRLLDRRDAAAEQPAGLPSEATR